MNAPLAERASFATNLSVTVEWHVPCRTRRMSKPTNVVAHSCKRGGIPTWSVGGGIKKLH